MKQILFLLTLLSTTLFTSCSDDDETKVETSVWYYARTQHSGDNKITATFYFFKDGDYNPQTFKEGGFDINSPWTSGEIKTKSGEVVKSFFIGGELKSHKGMGYYNCNPGNYYIVAVISSEREGIIWKAKKISVKANKITMVTPIFKDTYTSGYIEWDE